MRGERSHGGRWYDDEAGRIVRPYAMTRGRTCSAAESGLDLIALVAAEYTVADLEDGDGALVDHMLSPEHLDIVELCQQEAQTVAELASELDLPIGVVRVLVGDLADAGLVRVSRPVPPAELPDENVLRDVINGLRAL